MASRNYEAILGAIEAIPLAETESIRDVCWISDSYVIGVARDSAGQIEIFMSGSELVATSPHVSHALESQEWHRKDGPSFVANRIMLPSVGHFNQVAAFICTELLRNGAESDLNIAFAETEPIIEMSIQKMQLANQVIVGLAGELLFLEALCRHAGGKRLATVVNSWRGWKQSSRDFSYGTVGVEVKTTTGPHSVHHIQGVHQVDPEVLNVEQGMERHLRLASIGLQVAPESGESFSIPTLVDRIIQRLSTHSNELTINTFLGRLAEYGAESGNGYDHRRDRENQRFSTHFNVAFFRLYDLNDRNIELLRYSDLQPFTNVVGNSVKYLITLPTTVTSMNPLTGANLAARSVLTLMTNNASTA
ncbi:PD-(D/E)XK motif protein [Glutamicibacter mishrai]|uniref:PD-(D/E)XK motif protein n=1 Tax=Glutamicibacter mishrai TaxID=1775880 RepID=UPI003F7989E3